MDPGGLGLQMQALGKLDQIALYRAIEGVAVGSRCKARKGGDIDDPAEPALDHARQDPVRQFRGRGQQDLDEPGLILPGRRRIGPGQAVTGIVDQGVHMPPVGSQMLENGVRRLGIGKVCDKGQGLDPVPQGNLVRQFLQPVSPPGRQGDIIAMAGICPRQGGADPGGSAGHKGEFTVHGGLSVSGRPQARSAISASVRSPGTTVTGTLRAPT